jgi:membrane protease YdiL (CAAX protease family)
MSTQGRVKPLKLWQSILFFMGPGLYGVIAYYILFPSLTRLGISQENAYNTAHLTVFILLFLLTIIALRVDGWPLSWATLRERLRFKRMDTTAWKWTIPFLLLYLVLGLVLNMLAQLVYENVGFWPPDADIPLTNIPFLLIVFLANILSEELWWRGYILPRQEMEHGKFAWIVNGVLWSFFHIFKWWAVPFLLVKQWMLPFVSQRTKNTTPPFLIHLTSNGLGIVLSIIPLLSS